MRTVFSRLLLVALVSYVFAACTAVTSASKSSAPPITHEAWTALLDAHVSESGQVNYAGFVQDSVALNAYLDRLATHHPNDSWTSNQKKAYWINAYNAFTVQLIVRNYPVESIKELGGSIYKVNTPWDLRFIHIEGKTYDLNNIEHDILRKDWADPRIHFAINCASVSCPKLHHAAYEAGTLDKQLEEAARAFINDPSRNVLSADAAQVSRIFKWFNGDFTGDMTLVAFINRYANTPLTADAEFSYLEYDWGLNE